MRMKIFFSIIVLFMLMPVAIGQEEPQRIILEEGEMRTLPISGADSVSLNALSHPEESKQLVVGSVASGTVILYAKKQINIAPDNYIFLGTVKDNANKTLSELLISVNIAGIDDNDNNESEFENQVQILKAIISSLENKIELLENDIIQLQVEINILENQYPENVLGYENYLMAVNTINILIERHDFLNGRVNQLEAMLGSLKEADDDLKEADNKLQIILGAIVIIIGAGAVIFVMRLIFKSAHKTEKKVEAKPPIVLETLIKTLKKKKGIKKHAKRTRKRSGKVR